MLGRKTYTAAEIARGRALVAGAIDAAPPGAGSALWNTVLVALDRPFVHRTRAVTGKDTNPASELELLVEALLLHDGVLTPNAVVRYDPARAVLGIEAGQPVALDEHQVQRLATAFLAHLESHFLDA